jgi:hypothetical protein
MRMIGDMSGFSARELEEIKRRQDRIFRGEVNIRPAPRSRARKSQALTSAQIEQLRRDLLNMFRW